MEITEEFVMRTHKGSMNYVIYKYTFLHTDLIPGEKKRQYTYFCNICKKEIRHGKVKKHVFDKHYKLGIDTKIINKRYNEILYNLAVTKKLLKRKLEIVYKDPKNTSSYVEKKLNVDLDVFRVHCTRISGRYHIEFDVIVNGSETLSQVTDFSCYTKLLKYIDNSKKNKIRFLENFENTIQSVYDSYLGTPKEKITVR